VLYVKYVYPTSWLAAIHTVFLLISLPVRCAKCAVPLRRLN